MQKKYNYIDIYSGCGGISLGLYNSKCWKGLFAVEKSPDAFETLKHNLLIKKRHFNWPKWLQKSNIDITDLINNYKRELEGLKHKVDLIAGGPPCQGFSSAGRRQKNDKRNNLIYSYLECVKIIKPKVIFFENVRGFNIGFLNKTKRGVPYSKIIIKELISLGYNDATFKIVDFSQYGVPQKRERFIIIATKKGNAGDFFKNLDEGKKRLFIQKGISNKVTLFDAISDLLQENGTIHCPDSKRFYSGKYGNSKLTSYQKLLRKNYTKKVPDSHRFANHTEKTIRKYSDIIKNKLSSVQVKKKYNTKKSRTCLLDKNSVSPTLTTLPDDYVHYLEPRILTVREYARIQSFPDWFEFKGKYTTGGLLRKNESPRYTQVGNAIPPLFGEQAGIALNKLLKDD